ncbi:hypothetical protein ABZ078_28625 [Streptomyces sp. NPDC006385]|uniref:hypothetical protein n=1 Tax=Streptomyces sp. NPDC006385 TaxID=3156761 RepID=UPI0033A708C1
MPSGHASGPAVLDAAALEALLSAAVLRGHRLDAEGEQRAVAAFRAARAAGAHRARTRRRDDWRPREQRRLARSVKTVLSLFAASLALGGVAFATIGSSDTPDTPVGDRDRSTPSADVLDRPAAEPSAEASDAATGKPGHPSTAQDAEARCRAYDQVKDRGNALDATAWKRLVTAAGGADRVDAYCAEQLASAPTEPGRRADGSGTPTGGQDRSEEKASGKGAGQTPDVNTGQIPDVNTGQIPDETSGQNSENGTGTGSSEKGTGKKD